MAVIVLLLMPGSKGQELPHPVLWLCKQLWIHAQQDKQFISKKKENEKTQTFVFQLNVFILCYLTQHHEHVGRYATAFPSASLG